MIRDILYQDYRIMAEKSPIQEFFKGRSVLITGVTGFVGKVLLQKLLISCPSLREVFVLMRPKFNNSIQKRLSKMLNLLLFDEIKRDNPLLLRKIKPICGDVVKPRLGLNNEDEELIRKSVTIVFHSAAVVKFDEPLREAVNQNLIGTMNIIELCHKIENIQAVVYISTAFANSNIFGEVQEKVYPIHISPLELISLLRNTDDAELAKISAKLLGTFPNTYTFTKALTEHYIVGLGSNIPIAIIRPGIVVCSAKEPFPGWIDTLGGLGGAFVAANRGMMNTTYTFTNLSLDIIPVDICVNIVISAAWHVVSVRETKIFHGTPMEKSFFWKDIASCANALLGRQNWKAKDWHPSVVHVPDRLFVRINWMLKHAALTICLDTLGQLMGTESNKYTEQQRKVFGASIAMEYFTTHEWKFNTKNLEVLYDVMSDDDRKIFNFDTHGMDYHTVMHLHFATIHKFLS